MKTIYKNKVESPYQNMSKKAYDFQNPKHPINEEIIKNTGTLNLTATVKQDSPTLSVLKATPGVVAFVCTLMKDNVVLGEGRSHTIINQNNKYFERSIRFTSNASIIDSVVKSIKTMDALFLNKTNQEKEIVTDEDIHEAKLEMEREENKENITDKQKSFLTQLVNTNIADEDEKGRFLSNIPDLTKSEANKAIQSFQK
ncbi:hypothetical protein KKC45_02515 [Patescibacteria group bacterium]|nr:hypothetical protein [Patescibacteria group bacterium]